MKSRASLLGTLRRPPVEDRDTASETDLDAMINALPVNVLVLDPATANVTCANRRSIETMHGLREDLPRGIDPASAGRPNRTAASAGSR